MGQAQSSQSRSSSTRLLVPPRPFCSHIPRASLSKRRFPRVTRLRNSDGSGTAALVALSSNDLVVMGAELQARLGPSIKVGADVDRARSAVVLADGPVLVEGAGALDGRLVDALGAGDGVGAAVLGDGAELGGLRRGVVVAEGLDDVVLDERVPGPAVDGQVAVALWVEAA
jgi:hypothetical protein